MSRVIWMVIDSVGVGALKDSEKFGDIGVNTLGNIVKNHPDIKIPNMIQLGLGNIDGIDYLDMKLIQRSSDFAKAGCINQMQYLVFMLMIARHLGYTPGRFTWDCTNVQIYDRHMEQVKELLNREPIDCNPEIILNEEKTNFYDFTPDDVEIKGYPKKLIKEKNPQVILETAI